MSESPEFAALRRKRLFYEELAKRNREEMGMSDRAEMLPGDSQYPKRKGIFAVRWCRNCGRGLPADLKCVNCGTSHSAIEEEQDITAGLPIDDPICLVHKDACSGEQASSNQPPPGLPPEFRADWVRANWPEVVPSSALGRLRAALSEIAALNMQVVTNAKAGEAERDQLRAEVERLRTENYAYQEGLERIRDRIENELSIVTNKDSCKESLLDIAKSALTGKKQYADETELARLRSLIAAKDAEIEELKTQDHRDDWRGE